MFHWKEDKDKFKGEGIYHLTFAVVNRVPLLGHLEPYKQPTPKGHIATVETSELGRLVSREFNRLPYLIPHIKILTTQVMPDHYHAILWHRDGEPLFIKKVARGFSQGCSKIARRLYQESPSIGVRLDRTHTDAGPYACGNGANTLFSPPFIRTLCHRGQLRSMIDYVHANPDAAWQRYLHPELYVIRRRMEYAGLHFDTMGKERILQWPDRQVVALSRSLTPEQIGQEVQKALLRASLGAVTWTAAINEGEKAVAHAIRMAGHPLVVMLLDGFPPEGSEAARYYHPSGVYHIACGKGLLYLLAPLPENYRDPRLIALTEQELQQKSLAKGFRYTPLPHDSKRWRMVAGNVMLRMIGKDK